MNALSLTFKGFTGYSKDFGFYIKSFDFIENVALTNFRYILIGIKSNKF